MASPRSIRLVQNVWEGGRTAVLPTFEARPTARPEPASPRPRASPRSPEPRPSPRSPRLASPRLTRVSTHVIDPRLLRPDATLRQVKAPTRMSLPAKISLAAACTADVSRSPSTTTTCSSKQRPAAPRKRASTGSTGTTASLGSASGKENGGRNVSGKENGGRNGSGKEHGGRNISRGRALTVRAGGGWILCHDVRIVKGADGVRKTFGTASDGTQLELCRKANHVVARKIFNPPARGREEILEATVAEAKRPDAPVEYGAPKLLRRDGSRPSRQLR